MICAICHHPANQHWHGQPICGVCRYEQRVVDRRLNSIIAACIIVAIASLIYITH